VNHRRELGTSRSFSETLLQNPKGVKEKKGTQKTSEITGSQDVMATDQIQQSEKKSKEICNKDRRKLEGENLRRKKDY